MRGPARHTPGRKDIGEAVLPQEQVFRVHAKFAALKSAVSAEVNAGLSRRALP